MRKLLPIILALIGIGGGVGAGIMLKPEHVEVVEINPCGDVEHASEDAGDAHVDEAVEDDEHAPEYVKLNNQFVVPVVANQLVESLVVMSLSIEIGAGQSEAVYTREPKLRDAFLQVLFDHANIGGFRGNFTDASNMDVLRGALTEVAQSVVGKAVGGVLITDIARQDI